MPRRSRRFYQDIATAILRMEVVIRLEAMQALAETAAEAAGRTPRRPPVLESNAHPGRSEKLGSAGTIGVATSRPCRPNAPARWSTPKLRTIGYGLAAVACIAYCDYLSQQWAYREDLYQRSAILAVKLVERLRR